jgi:hypothetical protein
MLKVRVKPTLQTEQRAQPASTLSSQPHTNILTLVICFLLGNSPASEFYMPTFRNTQFQHHIQVAAYEDGTECSEASAYKIQTPGNYPEESIQNSEHGESLKSRILILNFHIQAAVFSDVTPCSMTEI